MMLSYPSLQCIIEFMEPIKRTHTVPRLSGLHIINRVIPLRVEYLHLSNSEIVVNKISYEFFTNFWLKSRPLYIRIEDSQFLEKKNVNTFKKINLAVRALAFSLFSSYQIVRVGTLSIAYGFDSEIYKGLKFNVFNLKSNQVDLIKVQKIISETSSPRFELKVYVTTLLDNLPKYRNAQILTILGGFNDQLPEDWLQRVLENLDNDILEFDMLRIPFSDVYRIVELVLKKENGYGPIKIRYFWDQIKLLEGIRKKFDGRVLRMEYEEKDPHCNTEYLSIIMTQTHHLVVYGILEPSSLTEKGDPGVVMKAMPIKMISG